MDEMFAFGRATAASHHLTHPLAFRTTQYTHKLKGIEPTNAKAY